MKLTVPTDKQYITVANGTGDVSDHHIFKVDLKDGISYALDLTGAQYGHFRTVTPWIVYEKTMVEKISKVSPVGVQSSGQALIEAMLAKKLSPEEKGKTIIERVQSDVTLYLNASLTGWKNVDVAIMIGQEVSAFIYDSAIFVDVSKRFVKGLVSFLKENDQAAVRSADPMAFINYMSGHRFAP